MKFSIFVFVILLLLIIFFLFLFFFLVIFLGLIHWVVTNVSTWPNAVPISWRIILVYTLVSNEEFHLIQWFCIAIYFVTAYCHKEKRYHSKWMDTDTIFGFGAQTDFFCIVCLLFLFRFLRDEDVCVCVYGCLFICLWC